MFCRWTLLPHARLYRTVFPLLDNAILMLEERVTHLERGYKNYLFVSTAYGLLLSQDCPEQSEN
jgi:hypothetical protein